MPCRLGARGAPEVTKHGVRFADTSQTASVRVESRVASLQTVTRRPHFGRSSCRAAKFLFLSELPGRGIEKSIPVARVPGTGNNHHGRLHARKGQERLEQSEAFRRTIEIVEG